MNKGRDAPAKQFRDKTWAVAAAVFIIALSARLLFLYFAQDKGWPHCLYYEGDAPVWVEYARALNQGEAFESDLPLRTPGVAYLLHFLSSVGMDLTHFAPFKVLWCVAAAGVCATAFLCYLRQGSRRVTMIATLLCVFSFGSYVISTSLNNEALYGLLVTLLVFGTLRLADRPNGWLAAAMGVGHGAALLLRAEHLLLVVMFTGYSVARLTLQRSGSEATRWRRVLKDPAVMMLVAVLTCLPWSIKGSLASRRFNETALSTPDYEHAQVPWAADARAFMESLPAFARADNVAYVTHLCAQAGDKVVTHSRAEELLLREFAYIPEPLSSWVFVSSQGPLSFALANHPDADGGFTKAALDARFAAADRLHLALPSHLRLYNRGYEVGLGYIRADVGRWLGLVVKKLANFFDGVTLGFGAYNAPIGREGVRKPVDLMTPLPGAAPVWRIAIPALLVLGVCAAMRRRCGGVWLVVIAYKLIVTVLFYGYARQAVSVLPAFYFFLALGVDEILEFAGRRFHFGRYAAVGAWVAITAIMFGVDIHAGTHQPPVRVDGYVEAAPHWGADAILSFERIEIHPLTSDSP